MGMPASEFVERRQHARVFDAIALQIEPLPETFRGKIATHLQNARNSLANASIDSPTHKVNISVDGISFGVSEPLPAGQAFLLKMQFFPEHLQIVAIAEIVGCRIAEKHALPGEFCAGVRFLHFDSGDRARLSAYIDALQRSTRHSNVITAHPHGR